MIKANTFIAALMAMLGWGYVLSAQGEVYTQSLAGKWAACREAGEPPKYFLVDCAKWLGHRIVDCSGLVIQAIRSAIPGYNDQTADELYAACKRKGDISTIPEEPGVCVHHPGHIGVYLGGGKVIEAAGHLLGVIISDLKNPPNGPWTGWGELAAVDYSNTPAAQAFTVSKVLKSGMNDAEVIPVSDVMTARGFMNRHTSIFDQAFKNAVIAYQKSKGLYPDGQVGPKTTAALGGEWAGKQG